MPKTRLLAGAELWPEIARIARRAKGGKLVATAYLGQGSVDALGLRRGDALHCALSLANVKAGAVFPADLVMLGKQGVKVYASESLHAKIYLFGDIAIVGSANVSARSRQLDEAAIVTSDPAIVANVRSWFSERQQQEPVTRRQLEVYVKAYRPPRWPGLIQGGGDEGHNGKRKPAPRTSMRPNGACWWVLMGVSEATSYSEEDERAVERADRAAVDRGTVKSADDLVPLRWGGETRFTRDVRPDDWIISVSRINGTRVVFPAERCHAVRRYTSNGRTPRTMLSLESASDVSIPYSRFVKAARERGVELGKTRSTRVTDPAEIRVLAQLASPKGLRALKAKHK